MNNNIRDLLMSENKDDVALGLIIAHKEGISVREIDKEVIMSHEYLSVTFQSTIDVFERYLSFVYMRWKEEMFI